MENTTTHIGHVRKNLPTLLREKIGAGHVDWTAFLQAIRDIDTDYIQDSVDIWKNQLADQATVKKRIEELERLVTASPTAPIQQQMSTFRIGNQPPTTPATPQQLAPVPLSANPFNSTSGGRGNLFTQKVTNAPYTPRPPPTQADKTALQAQLAKYPQHPDTDAGRKAHQAQQTDWVKVYGIGTRVTEATPYPLCPGTAPINSGECFTCGFTGHLGRRDSSTCDGRRPLHPNEQAWRSIASRILREPRGAVSMNLIAIDDYGTVWQGEQGNGEGPSV